MELFKNTLFINLDHRTDRLEHATKEFEKMNINAERVSGIRPKSGAVGCTMSHIRCIELAKKRNYEYVFVCEDDITFTNPELLQQNLQKFYDNEDLNWDVLIIGGNSVPPYQKLDEGEDYAVRVFNCQTTTGYIVKQEMYDTFISNFKEGVKKLVDTSNGKLYSLDIYWKKMQMQYYWYMITPATVTQYENYSDIEQRQTNYNHLMLDMEKKWLIKQQQQQQMRFT